MEFRSGNLLFTSKFDSGNLANVERVCKDEDEGGGGKSSCIDLKPDYEYNVWTKPDCAGTEYENGNRSWFYFGIRGWAPNRLIKINIMNLNRQGKLYSQGHTPFVKTIPGKPKWERLRDRPSFEMVDGQFILSFIYRFPEFKGSTTYFAFCFPWSYTESQNQMSELDNRFEKCKTFDTSTPVNSIYYHRELVCLTLDKLRVDLLTITSCHGITKDTEPRFDKHLFPDQRNPRCKRFKGKKVYFLSSRVHPGETPGSFVYNGFLEFILREKDPRAIQLRKQYVFKLIPMLNPDGVMRGHYRTDPRGVNLNRVYLDPSPALHPSIYAAKSLLVYHHIYNRNISEGETETFQIGFPTSENLEFSPQSTSRTVVPNSASCDDISDTETGANAVVNSELRLQLSELTMSEDYRGDSAFTDKLSDSDPNLETEHLGNEGSEDEGDYVPSSNINAPHLVNPKLLTILPSDSGIAFYVDLHGHASKRGAFIYGNYVENEEMQVDNMLYTKLISLNTAHFDFTGCNFSERNMYSKDKRDGMSKEGSGRVSTLKAIGIIHSYTLECNYNTGRMVNPVPPAQNDDGRATPPPLAGFPPKYTQAHYEEIGKALAIAALDMTDSNPWSRIGSSEHCSLQGVRESVRRFLRSLRGGPRGGKNGLSRIMNRIG
ncbi:hypothetical protein LOTGIDRAFT_102525 [Lottia gigantea]|uniref:tubulin-glutamate carboxypeptidase n=1 Tax=Lottia gigantea TaxID=225164 RepID=V4B554_LOTGI|nr:hypothetical protein LOTGIDRAFT_102525 [Lottia gigantea]ESP05628.1 hypothetical protein LOTGIDRAFT_102525 [Lottia gigantea]